jgi:dynein heavy chain
MAVQNGTVLMIDSLGQEIDPLLDPLLGRQYVKKGRSFVVRIGSEDVEIAGGFKLYLQTKMLNPHYKPEIAAQCTIINFIVTEAGLEDQLLAMVVRVEKPDLEQTKEQLTEQSNEFKIILAKLEKDLLDELSAAEPATILENTALIESLEKTKETSTDIKQQQEQAKETEHTINTLREVYRRVATEGSMLYFLLILLCVVNPMYQYSLSAFQDFFFKAIERTTPNEDEEIRVKDLVETIRMTIYQWISRGLFERHLMILLCQLTFRLMNKGIISVDYTQKDMDFLLNCPMNPGVPKPDSIKDWCPDTAWFSMQKLIELEGFEQFASNVDKDAPKKFEEWYNEISPEDEKLPLEWRKLE